MKRGIILRSFHFKCQTFVNFLCRLTFKQRYSNDTTLEKSAFEHNRTRWDINQASPRYLFSSGRKTTGKLLDTSPKAKELDQTRHVLKRVETILRVDRVKLSDGQ